ncbi:MAG: class I SAM-dependent methyltransferase [Patescibacteria group bacterium]|nr:class I SAM-dependent methyltransferase [Patescibacteria group bacterium]
MDKSTIEAYDKIAQDFQSRNSVTLYDDEYRIFNSLMGDKKKVLEIGCGIGRDAEELIKQGFDYTGVDAAGEMLKIAREQVPQGNFLVGDFYKLDFPDASFDGFWAAASFLHVPKSEINGVLKEAKRILKPEGVGFISLKEKTTMSEGVIKEAKAGGIERYFSFYTEKEFENMLIENEFQVARITTRQEQDKNNTVWLCFFIKKK